MPALRGLLLGAVLMAAPFDVLAREPDLRVAARCVALLDRLQVHDADAAPLHAAWQMRLQDLRRNYPEVTESYVRGHMSIGYEASFIILRSATIARDPWFWDRWWARRIADACGDATGAIARRLQAAPGVLFGR